MTMNICVRYVRTAICVFICTNALRARTDCYSRPIDHRPSSQRRDPRDQTSVCYYRTCCTPVVLRVAWARRLHSVVQPWSSWGRSRVVKAITLICDSKNFRAGNSSSELLERLQNMTEKLLTTEANRMNMPKKDARIGQSGVGHHFDVITSMSSRGGNP
eukprot:1194091-Prorocentrum_minimum.AAC.1